MAGISLRRSAPCLLILLIKLGWLWDQHAHHSHPPWSAASITATYNWTLEGCRCAYDQYGLGCDSCVATEHLIISRWLSKWAAAVQAYLLSAFVTLLTQGSREKGIPALANCTGKQSLLDSHYHKI